MKIIISNKINILNPDPALRLAIKQTLKLPNPDYHKMIKKNPKLRYAPYFKEHITYYEEKRQTISIPVGCYSRLRRFLRQGDYRVEIQDDRAVVPAEFKDTIKLRAYQQGVPGFCRQHETGIFRLDTGFGKTIIALKVASILKQKTLIIVPKLDLLNQFKHEIKKYFGFEPGCIQGRNFKVKDITIATAQSLRNRITDGVLTPGGFGAVLVDEAHLFVPDKTRRVLEYFTARYKYGFTATARRTDGQGDAIRFIMGDVLVDKKIPSATPQVVTAEYDGFIPMLGEYHEIIKWQSASEERNAFLAKLIKQQVDRKRKVLVLTKRVKHYEVLEQRLKSDVSAGVYSLSSKAHKSERDELLQKLRKETDKSYCLFGTFSLLSTGIDIPALDCLVLAGDLKSDVLLEQSGGRIRRLFKGKKTPIIIDVQDTGNAILKNQAKARMRAYNQLNWEII